MWSSLFASHGVCYGKLAPLNFIGSSTHRGIFRWSLDQQNYLSIVYLGHSLATKHPFVDMEKEEKNLSVTKKNALSSFWKDIQSEFSC